MKKVKYLVMVVIVAILSVVSLVGCASPQGGGTDADGNEWIYLRDNIANRLRDFYVKEWVSKPMGLGPNWSKVDVDGVYLEDIKNDNLALNNYGGWSFPLKSNMYNNDYSKIAFTIDIEEETSMRIKWSAVKEETVLELKQGINLIEIDYIDEIIYKNVDDGTVEFSVFIRELYEINWSISDIKVRV